MILIIKDGMECLHDLNYEFLEYEIPLALTSIHELHEHVEDYVYKNYELVVENVDVIVGDCSDGMIVCTGRDISRFTEIANCVWVDCRLMHTNPTDSKHEIYKRLYCMKNYIPCQASIFRIFHKRVKLHLEQTDELKEAFYKKYSIEKNENLNIVRLTQSLVDDKDQYPPLPPPLPPLLPARVIENQNGKCIKSEVCSRGFNHRGLCNRSLA
tara:strand:+ start:61 stop:696 length:636 start_codon:yes stop_codon:yes gene_type:complete